MDIDIEVNKHIMKHIFINFTIYKTKSLNFSTEYPFKMRICNIKNKHQNLDVD